jgi:hypothetical protein
VLLRLGEPASLVPAPVAALLLEHIANRDNMNTATNGASRWLFPGRRAGQPSRPDHLSALLNEVGVPTAAARGAAVRQQLLELPAPVVADALGYHDKTATRLRLAEDEVPDALASVAAPQRGRRGMEPIRPPATTHDHPQAGLRRKLTAVEPGNGVAGQGTA